MAVEPARHAGLQTIAKLVGRKKQAVAGSLARISCVGIGPARDYYLMGDVVATESKETAELLARAGQGDSRAVGHLFALHQERLRRMVQLRMDRRLQGRLNPSDVLQEAFLEVSKALADYLRNPAIPFFLWLRMITGRKLHTLHRHHLGTHARDAGREVSLHRGALPQASSESLAAQLLGRFTSPSQAAIRAELQIRVQEALNSMDPLDREVLALRHFEQLKNGEIAHVLQISETAASNRFVRALERLKDILTSISDLVDDQPKKTVTARGRDKNEAKGRKRT
jgi:RNA polymerase sigma-70 factor (ECF subfamily)